MSDGKISNEKKAVIKSWITTVVVLLLIGGTAFASYKIIKSAKDKKAAAQAEQPVAEEVNQESNPVKA